MELTPHNRTEAEMLATAYAVIDDLTARNAELEAEIKRRDMKDELDALESLEPGFLEDDQNAANEIRIAELREALKR